MPKMFSSSTMFSKKIFCPWKHEKTYLLTQIQPKSQFLFHKNLPPRDFSIMTLAGTGLLPNLILFKLSFRAWGLKRCVLSLWHSSLGKFHALIKIQNLFWNLLKQVNANNNLFQHSTAESNRFWSRILMVFHKIFGQS